MGEMRWGGFFGVVDLGEGLGRVKRGGGDILKGKMIRTSLLEGIQGLENSDEGGLEGGVLLQVF